MSVNTQLQTNLKVHKLINTYGWNFVYPSVLPPLYKTVNPITLVTSTSL